MRNLLTILLLAWWTNVVVAAEPVAKNSATNAIARDELGFPKDPAAARALGEQDARRDLTNGVLKIKSAGLPVPSLGNFNRLLKERCHCEIDFVAGCMVTEGSGSYLQGYNEISQVRLFEKFGTNILDQLQQQAEDEWSHPSHYDYDVKKGDTLLKIARQYGVTLKALLQANPEIAAPRIKLGQHLIIPVAESKATNSVTELPRQK